MWTDTTRAHHARSGLALPSDLTDGEWAVLEPFFPPPSFGGARGYDAGKKVKGRKRHIITDTNGFLVHAIIHSADIQDRDGAPLVLKDIR